MMTILSAALGLRRLARNSAVALVALMFVGGGALVVAGAGGLIPDPSGVIHGCYDTTTGAMRVVPSAINCAVTETPLAWNQAGVPGATGPAGPLGLPGIARPAGAAGTHRAPKAQREPK